MKVHLPLGDQTEMRTIGSKMYCAHLALTVLAVTLLCPTAGATQSLQIKGIDPDFWAYPLGRLGLYCTGLDTESATFVRFFTRMTKNHNKDSYVDVHVSATSVRPDYLDVCLPIIPHGKTWGGGRIVGIQIWQQAQTGGDYVTSNILTQAETGEKLMLKKPPKSRAKLGTATLSWLRANRALTAQLLSFAQVK